MPRKTQPRLRTVTIKGKEFHQVSVLSWAADGDSGPLRTRMTQKILFSRSKSQLIELLKQGLCWVYEKYVAQASAEIQTRYRYAQDAAQAERAGLWRYPAPVPPWE